MGTSKQPNRFDVSARLDSLRDHIGRGLGSGAEGRSIVVPLSEVEQKALLRASPDFVFRISLRRNSVSVTGNGTSIVIPTGTTANHVDQPAETNDPDDTMRILCEEMAKNAEGLMTGFLQTGEVQALELQLERNGQTTYYEIRVAACEANRLLAVVRDVTALREAEDSIARSRDEVTRLNEALQNEASLRAEEEEIIRKGFTRLERLLEEIIDTISLIVQKKDPNTARHQERVSRLACAIGLEMGLKRSQVDVIGLAAILHDLGNVFISAETLDKPGKLNEAELSAIKNHTETEFQVLKTIDLFFPIADIVHQHHERMDGSGYPLGLKGDAILMEARVIAVADVVEAMVSDRPHRRAPGLEAAMKEIASGKGTLYDANAVDACIRLFRDGKFEFDEADTDSSPVTKPSAV